MGIAVVQMTGGHAEMTDIIQSATPRAGLAGPALPPGNPTTTASALARALRTHSPPLPPSNRGRARGEQRVHTSVRQSAHAQTSSCPLPGLPLTTYFPRRPHFLSSPLTHSLHHGGMHVPSTASSHRSLAAPPARALRRVGRSVAALGNISPILRTHHARGTYIFCISRVHSNH